MPLPLSAAHQQLASRFHYISRMMLVSRSAAGSPFSLLSPTYCRHDDARRWRLMPQHIAAAGDNDIARTRHSAPAIQDGINTTYAA